jgi:hypothetical protein
MDRTRPTTRTATHAGDRAALRVVPLDGADAELVAEVAFRLGRMTDAPVVVAPPRATGRDDTETRLSRAAGAAEQGGLVVGVAPASSAGVETDASRRVGVLLVPARRSDGAVPRLLRAALDALVPGGAARAAEDATRAA